MGRRGTSPIPPTQTTARAAGTTDVPNPAPLPAVLAPVFGGVVTAPACVAAGATAAGVVAAGVLPRTLTGMLDQ